jgi:hypothetical protein
LISAHKYKRFKTLSKKAAQPSIPTTKGDNQGPAPSTSILKRPKIVENDVDALPPAARPNPFSPVKKSTATGSIKPPVFKPSHEFPAFPDLFGSPVKRSTKSQNISPPTSPNPFVIAPPVIQPDSPFTAARKRIRGEDPVDQLQPDKKRRFTQKSRSTSLFDPFTISGSQAPETKPFSLNQAEDAEEEYLEESPVKQSTLNGAVYKPIFDDVPLKGVEPKTRTVSLPITKFFGKKVESTGRPSTQPPSTSNHASSSRQDNGIQDDTIEGNAMDAEMDEGEGYSESKTATLLAPTPVKAQSSGRWKGSSMQPKKKRSKANLKSREENEMDGSGDEEEEQELETEGVSMVEIDWKVKGPLRVESSSRTRGDPTGPDEELQDHEDENFQLQPAGQRLWMGRQPQEEDEEMEEEEVNIDVPPELREVLEFSPSKPRRTHEEVLEDIFSGKGDRTKRGEVWTAGDFDEEDSEEWDGDAVGWWEAEL